MDTNSEITLCYIVLRRRGGVEFPIAAFSARSTAEAFKARYNENAASGAHRVVGVPFELALPTLAIRESELKRMAQTDKKSPA